MTKAIVDRRSRDIFSIQLHAVPILASQVHWVNRELNLRELALGASQRPVILKPSPIAP